MLKAEKDKKNADELKGGQTDGQRCSMCTSSLQVLLWWRPLTYCYSDCQRPVQHTKVKDFLSIFFSPYTRIYAELIGIVSFLTALLMRIAKFCCSSCCAFLTRLFFALARTTVTLEQGHLDWVFWGQIDRSHGFTSKVC